MVEVKKDYKRFFPSVMDRAYEQSKKFRLVKDIMSTTVIKIPLSETMDKAAKVMGTEHIGSLIVTENGSDIGIVTERDLLTGVLARGRKLSDVKVREVTSTPLISITPDATIKEAAQTMIKKRGRLAVSVGNKIVGVVTASDLIKSIPDTSDTLLRVESLMTRELETADEKTTVMNVVKVMGAKRVGSVIITKKGEPFGIFTERDLLTGFLAVEKSLEIQVGKVASSPLITAPSWISVHEAASIMSNKHIRRLPLTAEENQMNLVGIITARDLVEAYARD